MLGQLCKDVGTNSFGLLLDEDKLIEQSNINIEIQKNNIDENVIDDLIIFESYETLSFVNTSSPNLATFPFISTLFKSINSSAFRLEVLK